MKNIESTAAALALISALIGATVAVESRYAKAVDMERRLDNLYARTLKLRILELQLKPVSEFTNSDRALLHHLQQELREATQ